MTMTELDHELERLRGSVLFDDEPVRALYRAALARAEAAEAEAAQMSARVAELESQAAQGWRPVTEDWPEYQQRVLIGHGDYYVYGWYVVARRAYNNKDIWVMDDDTVLAFESASVAMIVPPLPPAPQETE